MAAAVTEVRKLLLSLRKNFHCTICLDILTEPISTKCNHQFCSDCFKGLLSSSSRKNPSKCPLCKTGVTKRSVNPNPNLRNIVSAVRDVCEAADDDCLNLAGTPLMSQRVREPIRKKENGVTKAKNGKKCLTFLGLEDEEKGESSKVVDENVSVTKETKRPATRGKGKSSNLKKKDDLTSEAKKTARKKGEKSSESIGESCEGFAEDEKGIIGVNKEKLPPDGVSELLPQADISSSLETCDQDALTRIYNSQNNLFNRLRKRQELNEIDHVVYNPPEKEIDHVVNNSSEKEISHVVDNPSEKEIDHVVIKPPEKEEKQQKRKSDELSENITNVGKKKKKKLAHNLYVSVKQRPKTSNQEDEFQISTDSSKTSEEMQTQIYVETTKMDTNKTEQKYSTHNDIRTSFENNLNTVLQDNSVEVPQSDSDKVAQSVSDEVAQSVCTVDTASSELPNAKLDLETICCNGKEKNDGSNSSSQYIASQQLSEGVISTNSSQKHSDIVSPSPCDVKMNKLLVDKEVLNYNVNEIGLLQNDGLPTSVAEENNLNDILQNKDIHDNISNSNGDESSTHDEENVLENAPRQSLPSSAEGIDDEKIVGMDNNGNMICTPDDSDIYSELKLTESQKSIMVSDNKFISQQTKTVNKLPKTPTSSGTVKQWCLESPSNLNTLLRLPKTPRASEVVRIENSADFITLMKKIPSPNKDHLLFGNLSFSKVKLPHRKEKQSLCVSRRNINSSQLFCQSNSKTNTHQELSIVNERDEVDTTDVCSKPDGENGECYKEDEKDESLKVTREDSKDAKSMKEETTQESDLSTGSKINRRRKTKKRGNVKLTTRIEEMAGDEVDAEILDVCEGQEKESSTDGSGVSSDQKKISKRPSDFSDEESTQSIQSWLTGSTQQSNPFDEKEPSKKLKSKRRKVVEKAHNDEQEVVNKLQKSDLEESITNELLSKQLGTHKSDGEIVRSTRSNTKCKQNETKGDHNNQEAVNTDIDNKSMRKTSLRKKKEIIYKAIDESTKEMMEGSNKRRSAKDVILEPETEDIENLLPADSRSETLEKSFMKAVPQSEELIPPTPPVNNTSSRLNITDKRHSLRTIRENNVNDTGASPKKENEISVTGVNVDKKTNSVECTDEISSPVTKTIKPASQNTYTVLENDEFTEELTCSDQAFFADVDKYESEGDLKSYKVTKPETSQNSMSKERLEKEVKLKRNKNLIEDDLDSSFTCTDKMLCDEEPYSIREHDGNDAMSTIQKTVHDNSKNNTSGYLYGLNDDEGTLIELEDDIEVYTGGNMDKKNDEKPCAMISGVTVDANDDDDELSVSMLSAVPQEVESDGPAGDFESTDKTVLEETMYVEGNRKLMNKKIDAKKDKKSKTSSSIPASLKNEFLVDSEQEPNSPEESEKIVVAAPPSTGKKFRQSLKNIITAESEEMTRTAPSQRSVDFSVCSPEITECKSPPVESTPYQDMLYEVDAILISSNNDKNHDERSKNNNSSKVVKGKKSKVMKENQGLGNFSVNEKKCIDIDDDDEECDNFFGLKKRSKPRKSYPLGNSSSKEKYDVENDGTSIQKKSKSLLGNECMAKQKPIQKDYSCKEPNDSIKDDVEVEDQLFSPLPKTNLSKISDSKLKATKRTFLYSTGNTKGVGLKKVVKTEMLNSSHDFTEIDMDNPRKDNLVSNQKQKVNNNGSCDIVKQESSKDTSYKPMKSSTSLDKSNNIFEDFKSPPKVKRLSDETIPTSLRTKHSQNANISFEAKEVIPIEEDEELLDDSIWKISNMKQSTSRLESTQKDRYPFGDNMFSPPTPVDKVRSNPGLNKKENILYRNRYLERKIFSPPDSKKLLNESVGEITQKSKENIHDDNQFKNSVSKSHLNVGNASKEYDKVIDIPCKPQQIQFSTPSTKNIIDPHIENEKSRLPHRTHCDDIQTLQGIESHTSKTRGIESHTSKTPISVKSNTPKSNVDIDIQQKLPSTIKRKGFELTNRNEKLPHDYEFETPRKSDLVPLAQSTTYREQYNTENVKDICDIKNESKTVQMNDKKDTATSHTENGTPKTKRENVLQNVCLPTPKVHTTTDNHVLVKNSCPVIMTSRLTKKQMMFCYSVCQKLGGKVVQNYSESVTHLIVAADENNSLSKMAYTYKYLMALVSGLWIVNLKWVFVSSQNGKFIEEDKFEAKGDPVAHHTNIPRLFRTASEAKRRCLFENYRMYVVGTFQQTQITREQLFMLLQKCGVEVIFSHTEAICSSTQMETVLLTDNLNQLSPEDIDLCNKHYLQPIHPDWVVESIINFRVEDTMLHILQPSDE